MTVHIGHPLVYTVLYIGLLTLLDLGRSRAEIMNWCPKNKTRPTDWYYVAYKMFKNI